MSVHFGDIKAIRSTKMHTLGRYSDADSDAALEVKVLLSVCSHVVMPRDL